MGKKLLKESLLAKSELKDRSSINVFKSSNKKREQWEVGQEKASLLLFHPPPPPQNTMR